MGTTVSDIPVLRVDTPGDLLTPGLRTQITRAERRLAADGLAPVDVVIIAPTRLRHAGPVIEEAHIRRDRARGGGQGISDLDDLGALEAWRKTWAYHLRSGTLELTVLELDDGRLCRVMAAYCVAVREPPVYRVLDSRMVDGFARYSPGRVLEDLIIRRLQADREYRVIDWGSAEHSDALIAVS
jgi:hypothetical protein